MIRSFTLIVYNYTLKNMSGISHRPIFNQNKAIREHQ